MGRRKAAAKKVVKRIKYVVARTFKCLFCNHEGAVTCSMDLKSMTGYLKCSVCDAKYQTQINTLSQPIDIFTEWLDETTDVQAKIANNQMRASHQSSTNSTTDDFLDGDEDE